MQKTNNQQRSDGMGWDCILLQSYSKKSIKLDPDFAFQYFW